ncbi:MAG: hypothetical protein AAFX53_07170 [Bacteroidota bacterium]
MKKTILAVCLMAMTTMMAQERGENQRRGAMRDLSPEQIATLQTKKMTLALDLTEAQQKQVHSLHLEKAKLRKAKMEERKERKENKEGRPSAEERYALQMEHLDSQIAHKAEMKEILSPEQYERWEKLAMHKAKRHKQERQGERKARK